MGDADNAADLRRHFESAAVLQDAADTKFTLQFHHISDQEGIPEGEAHLVIGSLTATTWSRARHSADAGPPPVRSASWPWGFPWVVDKGRQALEHSNAQLKSIINVFHRLLHRQSTAWLIFLHPEDLGQAARGRPASPWQLEAIRNLAKRGGLHRLAVFQCEFGRTATARPLGILSSLPIRATCVKRGWPTFEDAANASYIGPLNATCACRGMHQSAAALGIENQPGGSFTPSFLRWLATYLTGERLKDAVGHLRLGSGLAAHGSSDEETWEVASPLPFDEGPDITPLYVGDAEEDKKDDTEKEQKRYQHETEALNYSDTTTSATKENLYAANECYYEKDQVARNHGKNGINTWPQAPLRPANWKNTWPQAPLRPA